MSEAFGRRAAVTRPSLPPLVWAALAVWCGVVLGERAVQEGLFDIASESWSIPALPGLALLCVALIGIPVGLILRRTTSPAVRVLGIGALCAAVGLIAGAATFSSLDRASASADGLTGEWGAVVVGDSRVVPGGLRLDLRLNDGPLAGRRVVLTWQGAEPGGARNLSLSRTVRVRGMLSRSSDEVWRARDLRAGITARGRVWAVEAQGWREGPMGAVGRARARLLDTTAAIEGPGAALLDGMLLGYRERVRGTPTELDMRSSGLAHLLAVSGTHLAIVLGSVALVAGRLGAGRTTIILASLSLGLLFILLSGLQISAIRAFGVALLAGLSGVGHRRRDPINALAVVVVLVLLCDPISAFSLGFCLSVAAMAALVSVGAIPVAWLDSALPGPFRRLAAPLGVTLTATLATSPFTALAFGTLPIAGIAANLICVPLATSGLLMGLCGLALTPLAGASDVLLRLASWILSAVALVARGFGSIAGGNMPATDSAALTIAVLALFAGLWTLWPLPRTPRHARSALAALVLFSLSPALLKPSSGAEVVFLDVGQGDATLIRDGPHAVLIDTGPDPVELRHALARNAVRTLDAVVITHGHDDHYGGLEALLGVAPTQAIYASAVMESPANEFLLSEATPLRQGDSIRVGRMRIRVLWPPDDHRPIEENQASVVALASYGSFDLLLTGDGEEPIYETLAARDMLRGIEVLKSPHHGSSDGVGEDSLALLGPRLAVISVGADNRHGHPAPSTLSAYRERSIRVARTDDHGDITLRIGDGGRRFTVSRSRGE